MKDLGNPAVVISTLECSSCVFMAGCLRCLSVLLKTSKARFSVHIGRSKKLGSDGIE